MKRTNIVLLLALIFLSFGYRADDGSEVSKIYLIGSTLIRTTPGESIRFYDISVPTSVQEIGSIAIEQNSDVAATGTTMYADRGYDLMVFDISDPANAQAIDSVKKVFRTFNYWEPRSVDNESPDGSVGGASGCNNWGCSEDVAVSDPTVQSDGSRESSGVGGSLARFMIVGDHLYCIDNEQIKVFDISDPQKPRYVNTVYINWGIETIFHDAGNLFIGGQQGMYIYSIDDEVEPTYVGEFTHRRSCDPVVVEGDRAYVTLRGGSPCGGFSNQLDIIDISNLANPTLLKTVEMDGPYGLSAKNGTVLVCDGESGLKTLQTSDLENITTCATLTSLTPYDVIWYGNLLIVTAEEGFYLYDATDPCDLKEYGQLF